MTTAVQRGWAHLWHQLELVMPKILSTSFATPLPTISAIQAREVTTTNPQLQPSARVCLERLNSDNRGYNALVLQKLVAELCKTEVYPLLLDQIAAILGREAGLPKQAIEKLVHETFERTWQRHLTAEPKVLQRRPDLQQDQDDLSQDDLSQEDTDQEDRATCNGLRQYRIRQSSCNVTVGNLQTRPKRQGLSGVQRRDSETWEDAIYQVGQLIKQWRQDRNMSLEHLHGLTNISIRSLRALEAGEIAELPQPVFIQSFVLHIAKALQQDGELLLQHLPEPNQQAVIKPSWQDLSTEVGLSGPTPWQIGLGCSAAVVGAVGSWYYFQHYLLNALPTQPTSKVLPSAFEATRNYDNDALPTPNLARPERLLV